MSIGKPYTARSGNPGDMRNYGSFKSWESVSDGSRYPSDVLFCKTAETESVKPFHPTQKPVNLGRFLVRTFSNTGDVVMDNAFGSGSFLVAAAREGRRYIGIEKNDGITDMKGNVLDLLGKARERIASCHADYPYDFQDGLHGGHMTDVDSFFSGVNHRAPKSLFE